MLVLCQNCIFEHVTDNFFPVTDSFWRPLPHYLLVVEVLELPLVGSR